MFYLMIVYSSVRTARDSNMLYWEFRGSGNYSETFGWDDGLSSSIVSKAKPGYTKKQTIEILFENEYGGSRNLSGRVYAPSRREAISMLEELDDSFPVKEYERDSCPTCNHVNGHHTMCPENITNSDGYTYRVSQK